MDSPVLTALLMAGLALLTTLGLCWPWLRRDRGGDRLDRETANVAVYRSRLAELEAEVAAGIIDPAEAEAVRAEQAARLVADAQGDALPDAPRRPWPFWVLMAGLPVFATGWYLGEARWGLAQQIELARESPAANQRLALEHGVQMLERHLASQPEDAEAWARLGQTRMARGEPEAALAAFQNVTRLQPDNPDAWADEGEALATLRNQDLRGEPARRFERALALAPDHGKGLFYGGLAAAQAGDFAEATARWARLAAQPDLPPAVRQLVEEGLSQWRLAEGAHAAAGVAPPPAAPPGVVLELAVALDPALAEAARGLRVLTVFVRAEGGPPMPLAVQRIEAPRFPLSLRLSDADAMMPNLNLSAFERYEVVARLSTGGDVSARPGDLEGRLRLGRDALGQPQRLLIERRVGE